MRQLARLAFLDGNVEAGDKSTLGSGSVPPLVNNNAAAIDPPLAKLLDEADAEQDAHDGFVIDEDYVDEDDDCIVIKQEPDLVIVDDDDDDNDEYVANGNGVVGYDDKT